MKKGLPILITASLLLSFLALPSQKAHAVPESVIGPGIQTLIDRAIDGATSIPSVPTTDTAVATKEVKLCFWKICIPGLDKIAIMVIKHFIERMVDSTVQWISTGRDGGPAFVTDPKQYFTNIADGVAGEFIGDVTANGESLDFLCSPFKAQIRLALTRQYQETNPFQCTLTDVIGNIENFYDDFSQGGWDAWFSMTQNASNNPYGAYLEAKIELDSRIASAIGLEDKQLGWSGGFLNSADCLERDSAGECKKYGPTKTPGKVIEAQLEKTLGTGLAQLELADEFDELIGALLGRLLQETVFSAKGLFGTNHKVDGGDPNIDDEVTESQCPIPTTPTSLCESVDSNAVMEIVNRYPPSNAGITNAIVEINTLYPDAVVLSHPVRLDKIDFGGGLIVDIIIGAVGGTPDAEGTGWAWMEECACGGPTVINPPIEPSPTP